MNFKMIGQLFSRITAIEALFMIPALIISIVCNAENAVMGFGITIIIIAVISFVLHIATKNGKKGFYAREGLLTVGLSWIIISFLGCLPFWISGEIPSFIDALFETVSGFTTTGASILSDVEALSKGMLYWRSFSHWLGGMGVLVFILALIPAGGRNEGYTLHILRAESPGPSVTKLVPRMKDTAKILYFLYIGLTVINFIFLIAGKMPVFDAVCITFGTAGTGGFAVKNDGMAGYSPYLQYVTAVFMFLFGINFSLYYLGLKKRWKDILKNEELRMYFGVFAVTVALITFNIAGMYGTLEEAFRHSFFQTSSLITSTGYSTTDFDLWPSFSKGLLIFLMLIGACAGSTGGGLKMGRALLIIKTLKRNIKKTILPNKVEVVSVDGHRVDESTLGNVNSYLAAYLLIMLFSFLIVSIDGFSITTNIASVISCFNNMGPGLDQTGPARNFGDYGVISKLVLIFDMLAGRLEIYPVLAVFSRSAWTRRKY